MNVTGTRRPDSPRRFPGYTDCPRCGIRITLNGNRRRGDLCRDCRDALKEEAGK